MSTTEDRSRPPLVITIGEILEDACRRAGCKHVLDATHPSSLLDREGKLRHEVDFLGSFVIVVPRGGEAIRDTLAINLGDERCKWCYAPDDLTGVASAIADARPMWTDEVARLSDIADPGPLQTFKSGLAGLDRHGFRITLPAFMPIVGPYGSGKSVLLRQLLVSLWRQHGWRFAITAFEERVKPRYVHDFRRHLIGKPVEMWTPQTQMAADAELEQAGVFIRRKRNTLLDIDRLIDRIEFAVKVYGLRVVAIDPVNEIDHQVPRGENKTDYIARFIMRLKQLADDYGLLMICCLHPPKDGVEKRLARNCVLTLNDGADSAHWGNKADIGWCVWRDLTGPTYLHIDKLKEHEAMGKPTLAELCLDEALGRFEVMRTGYDILRREAAA